MISYDLRHQRTLNELNRMVQDAVRRLRQYGTLTSPTLVTAVMVDDDSGICTANFSWNGMDATQQIKIHGMLEASWEDGDDKIYVGSKIVSPGMQLPLVRSPKTGAMDEINEWVFELEQLIGALEEAQEIERQRELEARFGSIPGETQHATVEDLEAAFDLISELERRIEALEEQGFLTREEVETYKEQTALAKKESKGSDTKKDIQLAVVKLWLWFQARGVIGRKVLQSDKVASGAKALLPEGAPVIDLVTGAADVLLGEGE